jgi:Ca2+-binding EF-hand superfamily protein
MVVAHKSSTEEIGILRKLFKKFDSRGDGSISYEEFGEALADAGHSEEDLKSMFEAVVRSVHENAIASLMDSLFADHLDFFFLGFGRNWANSLHGVSRCNY